MNSATWRKVAEEFDRVAELAAKDRETYLLELERSDPEVFAAVQRMLREEQTSADNVLGDLDTSIWDTLQEEPPKEIPEAVDQFHIEREIGRGGMGVVYKAKQSDLNRTVALKMIVAGSLASEQHLQRLRTEAAALAALQHPNIVQIHQVGSFEGRPYLCLEYVDGVNLREKIANQAQPIGESAELLQLLARAIHAAHEKGIVHRDLKPANVLLANSGDEKPTPKIADFGLAKFVQNTDEQGTATGSIMGSPSYMAPEQARGKRKQEQIGAAADVYSLGAILYEMLTGRPPFLGQTAVDTIQQVIHQEPLPINRLRPGIPRDLETICHKCLQKEPHQRYNTAALLADDLQRFLYGKPVIARPVGAFGRTVRWIRRNPIVAGLLSSVVLAVLIGLAAVAWQWRIAVERSEYAGKMEKKATHERLAAERGLEIMADVYRLLGRRTTEQLAQKQSSSFILPSIRGWTDRKTLARYIKVLSNAKTRLEPLADEYPRVVALQSNLVDLQSGLAAFLFRAGEKENALTEMANANRRLDRLADRVDDRDGDPHRLGDRFAFIGAFYAGPQVKLWQPAREAFQRSAEFHQRALLLQESSAEHRKALSVALFNLGEMQRKSGRIDQAATTAKTRSALWPKSPDEIYDVACEYSRCARLIGAGKTELTKSEKAAREKYAKRAVDTLRKAVSLGLTNPLSMKSDPDLTVLHSRKDYKGLLTKLSKSQR